MRLLYSHRIRSRDGQSVHLEAMVAALRAAGHEVRVVGPAGYAEAALGESSRAVDALRRFLPGWVGELAELAYALPATWKLDRAAAEFRPDVIYERANLFHLAGTLTAMRRRLPLLLEVNAPLAEERARFGKLSLKRLAHAAERFVWRRASRVLPVTEVLADHVQAGGVPRARISVVPNGIHLEDFSATARTDAPGGEVVLGFVGFVRDWHGMDRVLRAIAFWQGKQRLVLRIVGDGPARPGLEALARELGIEDRLHFTGLASREAVPALVAGFDVALQPAAVPYACPLKVLEYMAAGCAIVAPDQPNLRELLEDGRTAILFDPADADAMWRAVLDLAREPWRRRALGAAARADIQARGLTWADHARRVVRLAEEAQARTAAGPAPATPTLAGKARP
jgi:glycosyltransferase involved in cell wall biosynthesis